MRISRKSSWNDDRLDELSTRTDEGFRDVKGEIKEVRTEIKGVRQEMKEGFAEMRGDMNQRFNTLTGFIAALIVVVGTGVFT